MLGRDSIREAYRVAIDGPDGRITGLVPDAVIASGMRLTGGRGHQTAYEWLSRHQSEIEKTLVNLSTGQGPATSPFDPVTLEEE